MATGPWDQYKSGPTKGPWDQYAAAQEQEQVATQKPETAQESTSNPFAGMIGQAASLTGAGIEAVAEVAERVGDKLELAVPLSDISPEDIKSKKQLQPLFDWAKSLKDFDESIGYQPSTQLKDLGTNPLNAVPFIAERVITSAPDMVAAVAVLPAYVMARTKQILDERVKNDEKTLDDATVGDVTAAATAAVIESTLERFATKGLFKPTTAKTGTGRVAKETGIQAGTEVAEEEAAYLGEAAGTKKGLSGEEALTRGAEAAIVGGGLGATVQGTKELLAPKTPPTTEQERQTILDTLAGDMQEPADLFADQEGQQAAPKSQVDRYKQRADEALRTSAQSAKYGDVDQTLPSSNEPPGLFTDVDTGAATTATSSAPAVRAPAAPAQSLEAYSDFVRQYTELRDEYNSLPSGQIDQAGMNLRKTIQKNLAEVVDANMGLIRSKGVANQLKNPVFDGSQVLARLEPNVGQPRAMQGNLFGTFQAATRLATNAMALSGQNPDGAIQELENKRARMQEKVDSGGYTDAEVISRRPAGMTSGQALKNRDSILQRLLQETNAEIDHAIDIVQKRTGQPRAMQGKLFGQPEGQPDVGTEKAENIEDVFNAANAAELNKSRMRATEKSKKIEAANRGRNQQAGASMTASERVALFKSERKRVEGELAKARAELTRLQSLAARPAGEIGYRPTSEDIRAVTDTINGYERTLQGVREQLQDAEADFDNGIETPTPRQRQEIQRVDLTAEQEQLFDTENFEDNAVEVTERKAAPIVDERGAIVPSSKKGENPIASAGFKTLDEDNNISDNLVGATFITGMDVSARNKGAGTRLLNAITNWADTNGKTLVLVPSANPDPELGGLSQKQLKAWYARNGFEDRVDYMVRVPTEERTQETEKIQETKPAEIVREGKKPPEKSVKAPATDTEHIVQTEEGGKIKGFFDSILPASSSPAEQERHGNSKNTAAETMLEFDIARPGETTSAGSQKMLDYLARRVGGQEKLNKLLAALQNASPDEQSRLLKNAGLPDLTTRRGMDEFSSQVQEYVDQMVATGEGPLYNIRTSKMRPSQVTGTKLPYQETITTAVTVTQRYDTPLGEKPRRPSQGIKEIVRDINDNKLRAAALVLKQMTGKISPQAQAAITYLTNLNRSTFGDALRDLAFDLAYFELDPKYYGAGSTFYKEGGKYAQDFRAWIETNLDASTVALLDELIAEHKQNAAEAEKFENAITAYNQLLEIAAEKNRKKAEGQGAKLPKAPRRKRTAKERLATMQEEAETEAGEGEETLEPFTEADTRNLPTVEMLTEVHPAIRRLLMDGDTHGALELLAQVKNNKYYAELAQRILDTGFTAETRLIDPDTIKSLSNDPKVTESLNERLDALRDLVETLFPQEQQASIISDLKSGKLRNLLYALETMQGTLEKNGGTESNQQLLDSVIDLVNREFVWIGKYEPASDIIVMRQGVGQLTNHLLLHESLHAAASHLLDNPNRLVGIQRQGYDRLNELFQYSKGLLEQKGITSDTVYGLQDLHEFVSEAMTNPELQALLRSIRYKAAPFSLWNRFTDSVSKLFNVKPGEPSNVMVEVMFAADAMMAGTMSLEGMQGSSTPRAMATKGPRRRTTVPPGMPNQPSTIRRWMMADTWTSGKMREIRSMNAGARKAYLGMLTLRQINDLVGGRIGQIGNFINVTEKFLARKSQILKESGDIAQKWERLQAADPEMSRKLGVVMHSATILEIDPDKATLAQRTNNAKLMNDWRALNPEAKTIYREVRNFYERRYSQYKRLMNRRIIQMRQLGVSEATITEIRNEFEKGKRAGPYFPLMRFGRFWYQVGKGQNREYYMFESEAARDMHRDERLKRDPHLGSTIGQNIGNDYQQQMDFHARESAFLKSAFAGVDSMDMTGLTPAEADKRRTELKDNLYQTYLANQPDRSMRNAFVHRNSIAGYSEDALRSFASSSFSMAYQMSRFEYSPEMFSQLDAARAQIKGRFTPGAAFDPALVRENDELRDYVGEIDRRLAGMLNPTDTGKWVSYFSNIGFIYYLTSIGSAVVNVMGGAMIGVPTLIGQQVRANPKMGYTEATARVLYNTSKTMAQIMLTGFDVQAGGRVLDSKLLSPSLDRSKSLSAVDRAAYNRFVADGLIDITAAYDQSGLASSPTSEYNSIPNKAMQVVAYAFHHAERFNREIIAMSAFRSAMEKRANYPNQQQAFAESIAEAKDLTARSMFDYSEANKPRFLQNAVAKIILQFKQFPQQMTWFLANSAWNSFGNLPEAEKREARARFVGTMGMAAIFSGVTGLWGFSTVAAIVNAVAQATAGDDDEPFDFELEFANWAVNTFGKNMGTMLSRGMGNAAGIDLHSRLSLDGMWFRDGRQNQDAVSAVESYMVGLLGPTVGGLPVTAARVYDLYNKGHGDRALEAALPGFAKQPMIAYRYSQEGAKTLQGDIMKKEFTPFELMMQSLGIRPADLAEIQFRNIKVKGQEQAIIKKRQNMLNIFALTFMANDPKGNQEAFDKIMKFNKKYPSMAIDADGMINSIAGKLEKSAQTDHGLYVDPKLQYLFKDTYIKKLTEKEPEGPWNKYKTPAMETAEE
jgi:hypothetical protein